MQVFAPGARDFAVLCSARYVEFTGEAGPESATGAPVGTVIIGIAGPDGEPQAKRYLLFGDRNGVRARAAQWALDDLRRKLASESAS